MTKPKRSRKPKSLLIDRIAPTLEERSAAVLSRGLPPDADEFDRACFEVMEGFLQFSASLSGKVVPKDADRAVAPLRPPFPAKMNDA